MTSGGIGTVADATNISRGFRSDFAASYSSCVNDRLLPAGQNPKQCPTTPTKMSQSATMVRQYSSGVWSRAPKFSMRIHR